MSVATLSVRINFLCKDFGVFRDTLLDFGVTKEG